MVFLCFSSKDRYEIIESIYYHLRNYAIPQWYDRQEILMGINRNYANFIEGISSCSYAVIILSTNTIASVCANEEIDLLYVRFKLGQVHIFPVFYKIKAVDIPPKYDWLKQLVYKELDTSTGTRGLCNHIACKYLLDKIMYCRYKNINAIRLNAQGYIKLMLESYVEVSGHNFNARLTLLYSLINYMSNYVSLPDYCEKLAKFLFDETKLNLEMDLRETIMLEYVFILTYNYFAFSK